jgi:hydroxymethylpyrimidine/phosphomethylpyrimidine kinase
LLKCAFYDTDSYTQVASVSPFFVRNPVALTIAGHDPSSGAGITADLQTFTAHGLFGISALTALTVQSTLGVESVHPVDSKILAEALECLGKDIPPGGVKIGMLGSHAAVSAVAAFIAQFETNLPVVLDPILRSSSGHTLLPQAALEALHAELLPRVLWITPNWTELAVLASLPISTPEQAVEAMTALGDRYPHLFIVATGGDQDQPTDLLRLPSGEIHRFPGEHVETTSTHGTGCAFSSALLSRLMLDDAPVEAVSAAKRFVTEGLRRAPKVGHGRGPLDLLWPLR